MKKIACLLLILTICFSFAIAEQETALSGTDYLIQKYEKFEGCVDIDDMEATVVITYGNEERTGNYQHGGTTVTGIEGSSEQTGFLDSLFPMIQVLNYNEEDETHRFVLFMNCDVKGKKLGFDQCIFKIGDKRFELDTILARGYYTESIDCYSETVEISTLSFEVIDLFDALLEAYENNTPVKLRMKGSGGHYDFDITNNIYYIAEFWADYKRAYMNEGL